MCYCDGERRHECKGVCLIRSSGVWSGKRVLKTARSEGDVCVFGFVSLCFEMLVLDSEMEPLHRLKLARTFKVRSISCEPLFFSSFPFPSFLFFCVLTEL